MNEAKTKSKMYNNSNCVYASTDKDMEKNEYRKMAEVSIQRIISLLEGTVEI